MDAAESVEYQVSLLPFSSLNNVAQQRARITTHAAFPTSGVPRSDQTAERIAYIKATQRCYVLP
jgi:hypothetical protein